MSKNFKSVICCVLTLLMVTGTIVFAFAGNSNSAAETETASEVVSEVVTDAAEDESVAEEDESEEESEIAGNTVLLGDVNMDGIITAKDARLALRFAARLELPTAEQSIIANVNGDDRITATDARSILRVAARLDAMFGTIVL